jgi:hypothetical protein
LCLTKLGSVSVDDAKSIRFQTKSETSNVNNVLYPYKPDLLFAHRNSTIVSSFVN